MAIFNFVSTSARLVVAEYMEELACEHINLDIKVVPEWKYETIKARYLAGEELTSEEFFFMYDYEEEQWRNSEAYAEAVEWLADPANRNDESYSDIYKDVYGHRPRW